MTKEYHDLLVEIDELKSEINHLKETNEEHRKINGDLRKENQKLKEKLNCKEYFSSTMPEDTEFVILTKNNYDRQQKDLALENIKLKEANEEHRKINGDLRKENQKLVNVIDELEKWLIKQKEAAKSCMEWNNKKGFNDIDYMRDIKVFEFVLNKLTELKGGSDEK